MGRAVTHTIGTLLRWFDLRSSDLSAHPEQVASAPVILSK